MRHSIITMIACILFVAPAAVHADDDTATLSLAEAITTALQTNANLKQAREQQLTALSNLRIASFTTRYGVGTQANIERTPDYRGVPGRIFGSFGYEGLGGTTALFEVAPLGTGTDHGYVGLQIRKPLLRGKGLLSEKYDEVQRALIDSDIQDKEYYITQQYTVREVVQAYYRAVLGREQVKVQQKALEIAKEAAEGTRKRAEAELIVALDVSRAEIRVAQTEDALVRQEQSARAAMDRLMLAIGAGVGASPELTDPLPETEIEIPPIKDAIKTALANRAELSVYDYELQEQARKIEMAIDEMRPDLDVVMGFNSTNVKSGLLSQSIFDQGAFSLGFEYSLPLDKRVSRERHQTAERQMEVIKEQRAYQMEQIAEQVWSAYRSLEAARASMNIQMENLKIAQLKLDLAQKMVDAGESDNRDVLDAQSEITNLESGILSARTQLYLAAIDLKYYMGEDITSMGVK